ncbi:MAG: hypothetical protein DKINENOH_05401 [bacterium]|nr:hypothetical protein [bacterium]
MKKIIRFLVLVFCLFTTNTHLHAQWVQNNGPYGGVSFFAVSGTYLFAGTWGGGNFRSSDNGTSWTAVNDGLTNTSVNTLAVSGANLFAGTCGGVFRSSNDGASWIAAGLTNTLITDFAVSGTNILAVAHYNNLDRVFRSSDNGAGWTAINIGSANTDVNALAVRGTNLFAGTDKGIFLSTDNGTSWTELNKIFRDASVFAVIDTILFAGTWGGGVFRSSDNGTSWTKVNSGLTNTYIRALAVSGTNLLAGTEGGGVFLSGDNGTSWTAINTGITNTNVRALAVSGTHLFASTEGDYVFRSSDNGTSWTAVNTGMSNPRVLALAISGTNLFAGTEGGGVFRSTDNADSWTAVNNGLTNNNVNVLAVSGSNLFAGTWGGGVFRSSDNGNNWTATGPENTRVTDLAVSDTNIFAGTMGNGIFLSTDSGVSWTATGLEDTCITALAVIDSYLFAGTFGNRDASLARRTCRILRSSDNGTGWTALDTVFLDMVLDGENVTAFAVIDTFLFAATEGTNYWGTTGILRSTDNGTSWTPVNDNLAGYDVTDNVADLAVCRANLFAASWDDGVFVSCDNGTNWTAVNSGLPYNGTSPNALAISDTYLFAGTSSIGVWRRPLSEMITSVSANDRPANLPMQFNLEQNYPNPFNPTTTIVFALPRVSFVTLKVYNLLGEDVATLVAEKLPAGKHQRVWEASGLASGIYLYRLQASGFVQTRKLILVR